MLWQSCPLPFIREVTGYSVATDVLAHVIERATGERIDDLLKKHIFDPLGMSETTFCLKDDQLPRLMAMYGNEELAEPSFETGAHELRPLDVSQVIRCNQRVSPWRSWPLFNTGRLLCFCANAHKRKSDTGELLSERTLSTVHANRLPQGHAPLRIGDIPLPVTAELDRPCDGGCGTGLVDLCSHGRIRLGGCGGDLFLG